MTPEFAAELTIEIVKTACQLFIFWCVISDFGFKWGIATICIFFLLGLKK